MRRIFFTVLCGLTLSGAARPASGESFEFTTIAVPDSTATRVNGSNDAGQVVGSSELHGFLLSEGVFTLLDAPGTMHPLFPGSTSAMGINEAGQIVGTLVDVRDRQEHGFLDTGGAFSRLDVPGSTFFTAATDINDAGQVVGSFSDLQDLGGEHFFGGTHGFLYEDGIFSRFDISGSAATEVWGINNAGELVGGFRDEGGEGFLGFLYRDGQITALDVPGSLNTVAHGINNAGQIVGQFDDDEGTHGFLWSRGRYTTLDAPGLIDFPGSTRGTVAMGIADAGDIVGFSFDAAGSRGFIAQPVPVAEPGTLMLMGAGLMGALACRRRQRM